MTFTFAGVAKGETFTGTVERGAQSEAFSIPKAGLRPYWDLGVTVEGNYNNVYRWLGQPQVYRVQHVTTQSGTDRLYASNINGFDVRADGFWNNRTARIYTESNGARTLLAEATVTATKVDLENLYSGANKIVTGTSFEARLENYFRPSVGYWFRVAAINGSGQIGTKSSWVEYTAPSTIGTSTASNTLSDLNHSATPSALSAPTGVGVVAKSGDTATAVVSWNAVGGASGYVVYISYQDPTLNTSPEYLDLDTSGLSIPTGAVFFLEWTATEQTDKWCTRVWNVFNSSNLFRLGTPVDTGRAWVAYTGGDPAPTGIYGLHYWRRTMSGSGALFGSSELVAHAGARQSFWNVLEANKVYRVRVLMRANASITATLTIGGVATGGSTACNLTTSWQWFEVDFSRTTVADETTIYFFNISVPGAATVDIAAFEAFDPAANQDDFSDDVKSRVAPNTFIRDHSLVKPGSQTVSMRQALSPHGQTCRQGSVHNLLRKCHLNDCKPWIQLEWHLSDAEWLDFVAYMAAPVASGHAMALMREAQGQSTPWVDVFEEVWLEFGNEAWNTLDGFWSTQNVGFAGLTAGESFGAHCQGIINILKTSPYWRQFRAKTMFYGGGFFSAQSFENDLLSVAPDMQGTGPAGYTGGWETSNNIPDESGSSFAGFLTDNADIPTLAARVDAINTNGATGIVYEAGPGYQLNGLVGASVTPAQAILQEVACKSRAMGTATIGTFCTRATAGYAADNFFVLAAGDTWRSHAPHHQGGGTYMAWGLPKMLWEAVGRSEVRKLPIVDPPVSGEGVDLIEAFEFKSVADPSNRVIVAINRDIDVSLLDPADPLYNVTPSGTHAMSIPTGIASCSGLKYYANVGNFRQHNRYIEGFRLADSGGQQNVSDPLCVEFTYDWTTGTPLADADPIDIDDTYGAVAGGLPAGNCVLLHLTGCVDA